MLPHLQCSGTDCSFKKELFGIIMINCTWLFKLHYFLSAYRGNSCLLTHFFEFDLGLSCYAMTYQLGTLTCMLVAVLIANIFC